MGILLFKNTGNASFRDKRAKGCFEGRFYCERARSPPLAGERAIKPSRISSLGKFGVPEKHPLAPHKWFFYTSSKRKNGDQEENSMILITG
ncbi:MAG: hypothetical protein DRP73_02590 [Candidatus Omnitrophota bacterium]|nr:MAG: hypothetical protein DRP73_02590 [Candidatus Omnitrophota bacterium]